MYWRINWRIEEEQNLRWVSLLDWLWFVGVVEPCRTNVQICLGRCARRNRQMLKQMLRMRSEQRYPDGESFVNSYLLYLGIARDSRIRTSTPSLLICLQTWLQTYQQTDVSTRTRRSLFYVLETFWTRFGRRNLCLRRDDRCTICCYSVRVDLARRISCKIWYSRLSTSFGHQVWMKTVWW